MDSRLIPLIALVVVATDAVLLATGTIGPAVALALFLIVEIPLGALAVTGYARRYRAHRARTEPAGPPCAPWPPMTPTSASARPRPAPSRRSRAG